MSNIPQSLPSAVENTSPIESLFKHELHHVRSHWHWFLFLGILMLSGGVLALVFPFIASVAAISVLSVILQVAGLATIVGSFWTGRWGGFLVHMLVGMLYLAAGFVITERPIVSVVLATLFVAVSFMVMGLFRILAALTIRFPQWGWMLFNGAITFLFGLAIYRNLSSSAVWVIGMLIGVELIFSGWTWIMLSLEIRRIPR